MSPILLIGIIVGAGFAFGELARKLRLPKVTGFILAGVLLNPGILGIMPADFAQHTSVVTNIALSFITFSVGGTLLFPRIRKLGKEILLITLCEGEFAFLVTTGGILLLAPFLLHEGSGWVATYIPAALLIGCLASPTDPSATLAVVHEYKARGQVTSTIMGVAALDDVLGIVNYSVAVAVARTLTAGQGFDLVSAVGAPVMNIVGAILLGGVFGFAFNAVTRVVGRETEGALIVLVLATLALCFGVATLIAVDELLATMIMGMVVVNFNALKEQVFKILERYTEELIFVLFFTLSGMHLDFSVLARNLLLVLAFVILRTLGKVSGATTGAIAGGSSREVRRYVAGGLIPQGGIVVGLALLMRQNPAFGGLASVVISVIIGATVIHELVGPVISKAAVKAAGEIRVDR